MLPTYQEAENIAEVLRRLRSAVPATDILVVDDGSPDGTADIAKAVGSELGGVEVLVRRAKLGLGSAYRAGFREGLDLDYEALVEMDSDLSHDPAALPSLLEALEAGADLSVGSRYVPGGSIHGWSLHRRLLSRWGNRYAAALLGMALADSTSGFRAYRADLLAAVEVEGVHADGYGFQIAMAYRAARAGARVVEMPIEFVERERGSSKMTPRIILEALVLVTRWGVRDRVGRALGR